MVVETTATPSAPGTGAADPDLKPGDVVGEYQVESKLGQGGFGAVFKAVHPLIGKQVAIKVLSHRFSVDPQMLSRFVAEARAVNQIRHHNIIDIFSFGALPDGRHYYVMEYLDGEPLDRRIERQGRLSLAESIPILRAIARALDAAHKTGIAHRDLKAENVFLADGPDGVFPKLLDFGIAKLLAPEDGLVHKTRTGAPMGTPHYMSPEQCHGRDVDHRTDMYAFGVLTYLMLTGEYPIDGDDYMTILMRQVTDEPAPPSSRRRELPDTVDKAVAWLMSKDPAARPRTLGAAVRMLDPDAVGEPGPDELPAAASSGGLPTLPMPGTGDPTPGGDVMAALARSRTSGGMAAPAVSEIRSSGGRRRRLSPPVLLGAGALVAAIAVVAVMVVRSGGGGGGGSEQAAGQDGSAGSAGSQVPVTAPADAAMAQAASPDAAPLATDAAPPARPAFVFVTIEGTPPNTEVRRAGELVGIAPGRVQLSRSDAEVLLVLSADGFAPATLMVTPNADQVQRAKLVPKRGSVRPPPPKGSGASAPRCTTPELPGCKRDTRGCCIQPTNEIEQFPPISPPEPK